MTDILFFSFVVVFAAVLVFVVTADPSLLDACVLLIACMASSLQYACGMRGNKVHGRRQMYSASRRREERDRLMVEGFSSSSSAEGEGEGGGRREDLTKIATGMTMYVTCFDERSYPDTGGKLWKNVIDKNVQGASPVSSSLFQDTHLHFTTTPNFTRREGFFLGNNSLSGPYSYQMGIRGDMAFTVTTMLRFTGDMVQQEQQQTTEEEQQQTEGAAEDLVLFKLFANTPGNNGLSLYIKPEDGGVENVDERRRKISKMYVRFGDAHEFHCVTSPEAGNVTLNADDNYLFVIVKNYNKFKVHILNVNARDDPKLTVVDASMDVDDTVRFSNMDMVINEGGRWNGNIVTFGAYDRALGDREVTTLHDHYTSIYQRQDSAFADMANQMESLRRAKRCPYDEPTCETCGNVKDWTDTQNVIAVVNEQCKDAITTYCRANPGKAQCSCWDPKNSAYDTTCKTFRCLMGGSNLQPECGDGGGGGGGAAAAEADDAAVAAAEAAKREAIEAAAAEKVSENDVRHMVAEMLAQERKRITDAMAAEGSKRDNVQIRRRRENGRTRGEGEEEEEDGDDDDEQDDGDGAEDPEAAADDGEEDQGQQQQRQTGDDSGGKKKESGEGIFAVFREWIKSWTSQ